MKIQLKAICRMEFYDLTKMQNFMSLQAYGTNKIKIDGRYYYIGSIRQEHDCVVVEFIEFEPSEHEIEICDSVFNNTDKK